MFGIFVNARSGSKRLLNKHLLEVEGRSVLEFLLLRVLYEFKEEIVENKIKVVLCTTPEGRNIKLWNLGERMNIDLYKGDVDNIPIRHLQCAEHFSIDKIICIDGDDILCCPDSMRSVYNLLLLNDYVQCTGLPIGMNAWGYSTKTLKRVTSVKGSVKASSGWGRLFQKEKVKEYVMGGYRLESDLRFTMDYFEDFKLIKNIITHFIDRIETVSSLEIIKYVEEESLSSINSFRNNEYWDNLNREIKIEEFGE